MPYLVRFSFLSIVFLTVASGFGGAAAPLTVSVRTEGASEEVYVGVVSEGGRFPEPDAETRVRRGKNALFSLGPGRYFVVAASRGHETVIQQVSLQGSNDRRIEIALPAASLVQGRVIDQSGNPVKGATIQQVRGALNASVGFFSRAALATVGPDWIATSDEAGRWSMPASRSDRIPVVISARGCAPAFFSLDPRLPSYETKLARGGGIRLHLAGYTPGTLVKLGRTIPARSADSEARARWEEPWLVREAAPLVEWPAVGAGEYEIFAEPPGAPFSGDAQRIATVAIMDATRELTAEVDSSRWTKKPEVQSALVRGRKPADLVIRSFFVHGAPVAFRADLAPGGTRVEWRRSDDEHVVALTDSEILTPSVESDFVTLLTPSPRADASLSLVADDDIPTEATVSLSDCSDRRLALYHVAIDKGGGMSFPVPAQCHNLVLSVPGYESVLRSVALTPGGWQNFGVVHLVAGARADVIISSDDTAQASSVVISATIRGDDERRPVLVAQRQIGADGIAVFDGLPVGRPIEFEAEARPDVRFGHASVTLAPRDHQLVMLKLQLPAEVKVVAAVHSEFAALVPGSRVTSVVLTPIRGSAAATRAETRTETVDERGLAIFRSVPPGRWLMSAVLAAGSSPQPIRIRDFDLAPGESRSFRETVRPVVFRGTVTRGGLAVTGSIGIADQTRVGAIRRRVSLDQVGAFSIVLPDSGSYDVEVVPTGEQKVRIGEVRFDDPAQLVRVALPTAALTIRVITDKGAPVAHASVELERAVSESRMRRRGITSDGGVATFQSLEEGTWQIRVTTTGGSAMASATARTGEEQSLEVVVSDVGR